MKFKSGITFSLIPTKCDFSVSEFRRGPYQNFLFLSFFFLPDAREVVLLVGGRWNPEHGDKIACILHATLRFRDQNLSERSHGDGQG